MNTKKKVYEALSREVKKVDLSAISDLEQAIGLHSVDSNNFAEVLVLEPKAIDFSKAMSQVFSVMNDFVQTYEYIESNYSEQSLLQSSASLGAAMSRFAELSGELGVDHMSNPTYEHALEAYDDLNEITKMSSDFLSKYQDDYRVAKSIQII
jgi:hypothetical protein